MNPVYVFLVPHLVAPFENNTSFFINSSITKKMVFIDPRNAVSHAFIFVQGNRKWKVVIRNKMNNPRFTDEETFD